MKEMIMTDEYKLDENKFKDMLGDILSEGDDVHIIAQVQEYVVEDGCPTDNNDELISNVYKAYLIFLDLSKEHYQNKIKELENKK